MRKAQTKKTNSAAVSLPTTSPLVLSESLLGDMPVEKFLRQYWHKKPLLIRQAVSPESLASLDCAPQTLFALAANEEVESRLIESKGKSASNKWTLGHGPFTPDAIPSLKQKKWTMLVQGVNLHHAPAAAFLENFRFVPDVRLDDIMISYATTGGGVGPHFDSYDVFLLQLQGTRRWQISAQKDLSLQPNLPLKILQNFAAEQTWDLAPGDMLYLPPCYAHDGVALDECMTLSVGFRAPSYTELAQNFYQWLADQVDLPGRIHDAGLLAPTQQPAEIPGWLVQQMTQALEKLRPTAADIEAFLGEYLSEPKPSVFFTPPAQRLTPATFLKQIAKNGLRLDAKSRLLYDRQNIYFNGIALHATGREKTLLRELANTHRLQPSSCAACGQLPALQAQLFEWYQAGYLRLDKQE